MKRKPFELWGPILSLATLVVVLATLSLSAWATVPERLRLQGLLEDANGDAVAGTADLVIQLYTTKAGTTAVFTETLSAVALEQGRFSINLGDAPSLGTLSAAIGANPELWLGLSINGGAELPRQRLESVPFALQAKDLECTGCVQKTDIQDGVFSSVAFSGAFDELINAPDTSTLLNGVGTANALPKYTAAGTLGDSAVVDAGGLIAIGSTNPANWKLSVRGDGGATGHVANFSTGDSVAYVGIGANTKSHYLYTKSNGAFGIHVPGVGDKLTILDNGNVGIGTGSPSQKLDVNGNISANGMFVGVDGNGGLISGGGAGNIAIKDVSGDWALYKSNGGTLHLQGDAAAAGKLVINTSGRVGIGTTSPGHMLHIVASSPSSSVLGLFGDQNAVQFHDTAGNLRQLVGQRSDVAGNTTDFVFHTYGGNWLFNNGNVGIGTKSPGSRLEINDGGQNPAKPTLIVDAGNHNEAAPIVQFDEEGETLFVVQATGNVGIGTTSPARKLHVKSDAAVQLRLDAGSGADTQLEFYKNGARKWEIASDHSNGDALEWRNKGGASGSSLILLQNGNVGIGDGSPTSPGLNSRFLDVGDGTNTEATLVLEENDSVWEFIADSKLRIAEGTYPNQKTYLTMIKSGNVGIGTTSPAAKLDVAGGVRVGNDSAACNAAKAGTLRWTGSAFEVCTGSTWKNVGQ